MKTEPVANYHGHATFEAKFKAANPAQVATYDNDVADLTAFMAWMSEPVQTFRVQLGVGVMLFPVVLPGNVAPERLLLEARTLTATPRQVFPSP